MQPLPIEITYLAFSVILIFVQIALYAVLNTMDTGVIYNASSRDQPYSGQKSVYNGRALRALNNILETFPIFAVLVLAIVVTGREGTLSYYGVLLYFYARIVYVLIYITGIAIIRSLVWGVSIIGIGLLLWSLLAS